MEVISEDIKKKLENSIYAQKAMALFKQGYNCSQATFLAFVDLYEMDQSIALRISSSFGGGMGRLREVCGAVSGIFMVGGILYGYESPSDSDGKTSHYKRIQAWAKEFESYTGSIVCRNLLGLNVQKESPVPEKRTEEYYRKRPCIELVGLAAYIMEEYIQNNKPNQG